MEHHAWKPISWVDDAGEATGPGEASGAGEAPVDAGPAAAALGVQHATGSLSSPPPSRQRFSASRLVIALLLVAGTAVAATYSVRNAVAGQSAAGLAPAWFAPYVDVTVTPTYQFQDPTEEPAHQVVLSFVVAESTDSCTPSWGGYYTLDQAASTLNLDQRVAQLRNDGVAGVVSFGGSANTDLAVACHSASSLAAEYLQVIDRYHVTTIDLDVEGSALADWPAAQRRAAAVALLEHHLAALHRHISVWLTLPVTTQGLGGPGLAQLRQMLHDKAHLAGVNGMAMDYGPPVADMGAAAVQALGATEAQLAALYPRYGVPLSGAAVWHSLGVTVMIGQNDDAGEVLTVADARTVASFARGEHLGRVSVWSLNRDSQCGSGFGVVGEQSSTCSGTAQSSLQFDDLLANLRGTVPSGGSVTPVSGSSQLSPANAPYPFWQPNDPYAVGYKVVWQNSIYESKWYNQGQDPAADVQYAWQTPWQLIGPVLSGERAPTTTTLPAGTYPGWAPGTAYRAGARILFAGLAYVAKWYNSASSPAAAQTDPSGSPWQPLFTVPGEPSSSGGG